MKKLPLIVIPAIMAVVVNFTVTPLFANTYKPELEIKQGADELQKALESMPYASEGKGTVIYVFEFSDCPYSQQLARDWKGKLDGVELRHMFFAVSQKSANETAALALSRDINDYYAYMNRQKTAPLHNANNTNVNAYNAIIIPVNDVVRPTLKKNGWPKRGFVSPQFFWEVDGKWYSDAGYTKEHFKNIMNMAKGSTAPAPAKKAAQVIRRNPSIKTFDFQGVKLGMSMDEADAVLTKNGYQNHGDKANYVKKLDTSTKMVNLGYYIMQDTRKNGVVTISFRQSFSNTVAVFDKDPVLKSVIKKYGRPDKNIDHSKQRGFSDRSGYSLTYVDYPNAPRQNKVKAACRGDLLNQGYTSAQAAPKQHAANMSRWKNSEDREVREVCPSVVDDFNHMIKAFHAPKLTIMIDAWSGNPSIRFDVRWDGPKEWEFRRLHQERQDKVKSAPVVDIEF